MDHLLQTNIWKWSHDEVDVVRHNHISQQAVSPPVKVADGALDEIATFPMPQRASSVPGIKPAFKPYGEQAAILNPHRIVPRLRVVFTPDRQLFTPYGKKPLRQRIRQAPGEKDHHPRLLPVRQVSLVNGDLLAGVKKCLLHLNAPVTSPATQSKVRRTQLLLRSMLFKTQRELRSPAASQAGDP